MESMGQEGLSGEVHVQNSNSAVVFKLSAIGHPDLEGILTSPVVRFLEDPLQSELGVSLERFLFLPDIHGSLFVLQ